MESPKRAKCGRVEGVGMESAEAYENPSSIRNTAKKIEVLLQIYGLQ